MLSACGPQKRAAWLIDVVRVAGEPPTVLPLLDAALEHLEAQVAAAQLVQKWVDVDVVIPVGALTATPSALQDADRTLGDIPILAETHAKIMALLLHAGLQLALPNVSAVMAAIEAVPAAREHLTLQRARAAVDDLHRLVRQ